MTLTAAAKSRIPDHLTRDEAREVLRWAAETVIGIDRLDAFHGLANDLFDQEHGETSRDPERIHTRIEVTLDDIVDAIDGDETLTARRTA